MWPSQNCAWGHHYSVVVVVVKEGVRGVFLWGRCVRRGQSSALALSFALVGPRLGSCHDPIDPARSDLSERPRTEHPPMRNCVAMRLVRRGLAKTPTICRAKGSQGFSVSSLSGKSDHAGSIRIRHGHMRGTKRAKEKTAYRQSTGLNPLTNLVRCQTRHQLMPPRRWSCRPKRHHAIIAMRSLCPQGLWDNVPTAAGAKRARFCHSVLSSVQLP